MSITFTTFMNSEWKDKIDSELALHLEQEIGIHNSPIQNIFAFHEVQLVGGTTFQKNKDILWIDSFWVEKKFRKQGIGRGLLQQLDTYAKQHSLKSIQLNTYFEEANGFFSSNEFTEIAQIPNWKYDLTCYLLKKNVK